MSKYAETPAQNITMRNGESINANGVDIPLTLWVGISKIPKGALSYLKTLEIMADAVDKARKLLTV